MIDDDNDGDAAALFEVPDLLGRPIEYDEGGILPKRKKPLVYESEPDRPIIHRAPEGVEGKPPAPVVDTYTRPPTNGGAITTTTAKPPAKRAAPEASINWTAVLIVAVGLWALTQAGKDK